MSIHTITTDAESADRVREHHRHLVAELEGLVGALDTVRGPDEARRALTTWLHTQLAPHAAGEEATLYRAAADTVQGRLLIQSMVAEHRLIFELVGELEAATSQPAAAAWAGAILRVFRGHADKENDLVLPLLVAEPGVDLTLLLGELHDAH
ncbi:cation-binding protein [Intrasporangium chromatireducens Q5-1]|uniref:Cation-binding protein n=1 Tax=Intrasporangium chromatireducens Q5-1 TaxID=584657 RepID=W9GPN3_9MICO|nr:hemerythrin domain-containing protein [Intrasporangium chromatireducens]EWT05859.1 cation-binding protein [Intrasporangium chromatireducens Q5-1]